MTYKRLQDRGKAKCPLPRVHADEVEKKVWDYLRTFFFYMDEKVEGSVQDKWEPKLSQAQEKIENLKREKKLLEVGVRNTESLRLEKDFPRARYVSQITEITQQMSQIDYELKEVKDELSTTKEMIEQENEVMAFAEVNPDVFDRIIQCIETLPFAAKQKLLRGMLVEPVKVFSPTTYMPVFWFKMLILQEIQSEYCSGVNTQQRLCVPCPGAPGLPAPSVCCVDQVRSRHP
jgi:hypothetical protein